MKFCVLIVFFASAYAIDFNCLKGPQYWCKSIENAQKCGRITECFITNADNGVVKMSKSESGDNCGLCKDIVVQLEKSLIPNMTEQQFVNYLTTNVCPRLNAELKTLCALTVTQYGPQIYAELKAFLAPDNVCAMMHLCGTPTKSTFTSNGSPETCKVCKEIFSFLESYFSKLSPDEFKALLKMALCSQMPKEVQAMCNTVVDGYSDQIYQLIKSLLDGSRTCTAMHLCSTGTQRNEVRAAPWSCQTCVDVVTVLKKDLINVSADDMESLVKTKVCNSLPFIARGFCNSEVEKLVPQFVTDIHSGMTPQQICAKDTLCASQADEPLPTQSKVGSVECDACQVIVGKFKEMILSKEGELRVKNYIKARICPYFGKESQQCVEFVDKYGDIIINFINTELTSRRICEMFGVCSAEGRRSTVTAQVNAVECKVCQFVLSEVKQYIASPTNQATMKNFLKNTICQLFKSEKTQCQQAVDEYFAIIINAVISEFDVTKICQLFKFCPQTLGTAECTICELAINELITLITSNASQQRSTNFLTNEICPKLGSLSSECVSLVKQYLPSIFKIVQESLNGQMVCSRLHLCSIVSRENIKSLAKNLGVKSFQCDLCQFSINETIALLSDTKVQSLLENFLIQEICPLFGGNLKECQKDITEYYSFVINLILQFLSPSLCKDVHLCSSSPPMMALLRPLSRPIEPTKPIGARICPKLFRFFQTINDNTQANDVILGVVGICCGYYNEEKKFCLNQLKNLQFVLDAFKGAKSEKEFCEAAKLTIKARVPSLGTVRCSWGPGFWCISRRHAETCGIGAVRHCELNVWKGVPTGH